MKYSATTAIELTQRWLTEAVIKYQFCPYAKQPYVQKIISYQVYDGQTIVPLLEQLAHCCFVLDTQNETELATTLLIIAPQETVTSSKAIYLASFDDYLDALDVANEFLAVPQRFIEYFSEEFLHQYADQVPQTWENSYQIAGFHPDYVFENTVSDDRENYTNRSPYPIFHLLRNTTLDAVRTNDKQAEKIVHRNIETLTQLSIQAFAQIQALAKPK